MGGGVASIGSCLARFPPHPRMLRDGSLFFFTAFYILSSPPSKKVMMILTSFFFFLK
jgi:hypothetical protein